MAEERRRTRLSRDDAQALYIRAGEVQVYRQLERDGQDLDASLATGQPLPLGPFSRLRADVVVDDLGKTRGAINHLWGNQDAYRAAVFQRFMNDEGLGVDEARHPDPTGYAELDDWLRAWAQAELRRGPRHGMQPESTYGLRWAAWLSLVPYGLWSERVAAASMTEFRNSVAHAARSVVGPAMRHFGREPLAAGWDDLALAATSVVEGFWLNAALTSDDPLGRADPAEPADVTQVEALFRSLRMVVMGGSRPADGSPAAGSAGSSAS